jgi:ethanolamine ammonia-lyase small subunit
MTDKQYKTKLTGFITSQLNQRDNCQILIVEGLRQYMNGGRTTRLSNFFTQSIAVKSIPTVSILAFIKDHANLKYAENKDGVLMFIKDDKSEVVNALPTELWYEHKKAKHNAVKEIDYSKRLTNDVKKAIDKGVSKQDMIAALVAGGLSISDFLTANNETIELVAVAA